MHPTGIEPVQHLRPAVSGQWRFQLPMSAKLGKVCERMWTKSLQDLMKSPHSSERITIYDVLLFKSFGYIRGSWSPSVTCVSTILPVLAAISLHGCEISGTLADCYRRFGPTRSAPRFKHIVVKICPIRCSVPDNKPALLFP